jgi:hypothetical protein
MRHRIYGFTADHTAIASCYQALGQIHFKKGEFEAAQKECVCGFLATLTLQWRVWFSRHSCFALACVVFSPH